MANLKTGGLRDVLERLVSAGESSSQEQGASA